MHRMWRNGNPHNCCWEWNRVTHCGRHLAVSLKLNVKLPYDQAIPFLNVYLRKWKIHVHTKICLHKFKVTAFIANNPNAHQSMNRRDVIDPCNGILFSMKINEASQSSKTLCQIKGALHKGHIVYGCTYMKCPEQVNL